MLIAKIPIKSLVWGEDVQQELSNMQIRPPGDGIFLHWYNAKSYKTHEPVRNFYEMYLWKNQRSPFQVAAIDMTFCWSANLTE